MSGNVVTRNQSQESAALIAFPIDHVYRHCQRFTAGKAHGLRNVNDFDRDRSSRGQQSSRAKRLIIYCH
jgi:hypothetical protein